MAFTLPELKALIKLYDKKMSVGVLKNMDLEQVHY